MAERDETRTQLCDIDHRRPAAYRVTVAENGRRRTLNVCREHYEQLRAQQAFSPVPNLTTQKVVSRLRLAIELNSGFLHFAIRQ